MARSILKGIKRKLSSSSLFETLGHSKNYLISSLAQQGMAFISIPIFTHLLTPDDYGVLNIFGSFAQIFSILLILNLNGGISRYYYEEKEDFPNFLGLSITLTTGLFTIAATGILIFRDLLSESLHLPLSVIPYFGPCILLYIIVSTFNQVYLPRRDSTRIMRYDIAQGYIGFALAVGFILMQKDELYLGRLKADVAIFLVFGFLRVRDIWKYISFNIDFRHLKYILNFCIPNIPYLLSGLIISQFDRIMINNIAGSKDAGLYSFAYNLAMIQLIVSNALHYAWNPKYYEYMNRKNYEVMDKESHFIIKLLCLSTIGLILFAKEIGSLLSASSYHSGLFLIPIILVGHFFVGLMPFNKNAILHAKRTYITASITLSSAVLNVVLNAIFIPKYGFAAAAVTTVVSYVYIYAAELIIARYILKYHVFPLNKVTMEFLVLAMVILIYYCFFVQQMEFVFRDMLFKMLIVLSATTILFRKEIIDLKGNGSWT